MAERFKSDPLLWSIFVIALLAMVAGLAGVDRVIAHGLGPGSDPLAGLVTALDLVTLKEVSSFLLGAIIIVAAALAMLVPNLRSRARLLLYIGAVQFGTTTICDLSKPPFGRLRPYDSLSDGGADLWWLGANSFPSGHAGFYAGLVFPMVAIWPKAAWPLLIVPALVSAQRVLSLDHYLSDVSASIAVAALLALSLKPIARLNLLLSPHPDRR
jgi:membrane-associated phospholipid phosphatase